MDPLPMLVALGERRQRGDDVQILAARFHESVVDVIARVAIRVADAADLGTVVLSGGSFQNARVLSGVGRRLTEHGLRPLVPRLLGPNDGAVSYGQAAVAAARLGEPF
jgi:hydrogenase maturation protein HypF